MHILSFLGMTFSVINCIISFKTGNNDAGVAWLCAAMWAASCFVKDTRK